MKSYTVVVLYPQRRPDSIGLTYIAAVEAPDELAARRLGAKQAQMAQPSNERRKLEEWLPLVVFAGSKKPLAFGWQSPSCY